MAHLQATDLNAIRRVEIDEDGAVLLDGARLETEDAAALGTALCRLGTRIHTAALEWEPAPADQPNPFAEVLKYLAPTPVPDIAGRDL